MKQREYLARQRYNYDPNFHAVVSVLEKWMIELKLSPNDLHDAVNLAGDLTSMERYYEKFYEEDSHDKV